LLWLATLLLFSSLSAGEPILPDVEPGDELIYFVIERQAPPFQIERNGFGHRGIVSDIVYRLGLDLGLSITTVSLPFKRMLLEMKKPENRNCLSYGSPIWRLKGNDSVQSDCLLSQPILSVNHSLVTRADSDFSLSSVEELFGQRLITLHGFNYATLMPHFDSGAIQKLDVKNQRAAYKAVMAGRGLGFVTMNLRVAYSFKTGESQRENFELHDLSSIIPSYPVYISHGCGVSAELAGRLDRQYLKLIEQGSIDRIVDRYVSQEL
tara:strand:- start:22632 stop:23426 length:795 start_codon:yes stop_codon:yes gene_type:complete